MEWTPDRVKRLSQLWDDGYSALQIAADLKGVSRNAVLGKVWRLRLAKRHTFTAKENVEWAQARAAGETFEREPRRQPRLPGVKPKNGKSGYEAGTRIRKPYKKKSRAQRFAEAEKAKRGLLWSLFDLRESSIGILDLTNETCRWPQGDDPVRYCGCGVMRDSSYCEEHHRIAHQCQE